MRLDTDERALITSKGLSERHARALLRCESKEQRREVTERIVSCSMNALQTEKYIKSLQKAEKIKRSYQKRAPILRDVRLFVNTMNKAVRVMQLAGVKANTKKVEHEGYVDYIVSIPV